jgi:hypothetical protein
MTQEKALELISSIFGEVLGKEYLNILMIELSKEGTKNIDEVRADFKKRVIINLQAHAIASSVIIEQIPSSQTGQGHTQNG